jgi:environmental stress-induced protein Ves
MKLIRYSDLSVLPWKNGAGIRRDIAQGRYHTDEIDSTWLVSIADLNENAAFSSYPQTSRWIMPISKGWLTLNFDMDGVALPVELTGDSPAHHFAGDSSVHCFLHDGPMKALNIMTSGDETIVEVVRTRITETTWITLDSNQAGNVSLMLVTKGVCRVKSDAWSGPVATLNSLVNDSGRSETFEINPMDASEIIVTRIRLKMRQAELAKTAE